MFMFIKVFKEKREHKIEITSTSQTNLKLEISSLLTDG